MVSSDNIVKAIKQNLRDKDLDFSADKIINYLKQNNLLHLLPNIIRKLEVGIESDKKGNTVTLLTSHEFDKELIEKIKSFIQKEKGNVFDIKIDNSLIGGFVIKGNNKIYDASMKRNLGLLRESLIK